MQSAPFQAKSELPGTSRTKPQQALTRTIAGAEARFDEAAAQLPAIRTAIAARRDTRGDAFEMLEASVRPSLPQPSNGE